MKQRCFWKLKSVTTFLILFSAFILNQEISCQSFPLSGKQKPTIIFAENTKSIGYFADDEDEIFALVNEERIKKNLNALKWDSQLAEIARDYSGRMADENFFDHFDPQGADVVVRSKRAGLKHWSKIGENLFSVENLRNFDAFAVENWMKSPTHRQNILDADFNTTGVGIVESASGEFFITQVFIKR